MASTFKKKAGQDESLDSKMVVVERTETHKMVSEVTLETLEMEKKMCEEGIKASQDRVVILDEEIAKVKALVE